MRRLLRRSHAIAVGAGAGAIVTDVGPHSDEVEVRFIAGEREVHEQLLIPDTVPTNLAIGDAVRVVHDPNQPSNVLLTRQLNDHHVPIDYLVGSVGAVAVLSGVGWWLAHRSRATTTTDR